MKFAIVALSLIAVVAAQGGKYTTKYDTIDLDEILKSDRLFRNYYKCLLDTGRCTADGNYLKKVLPEALENDCKRCSKKQQEDGNKVIKYLTENRSQEWKVLRAKYDPQNKYVQKYSSDAQKDGIRL